MSLWPGWAIPVTAMFPAEFNVLPRRVAMAENSQRFNAG